MNSIAKGFSSSFTNDAEIEYTRKQMLKALKRNLSRKTALSQEEIDTKAEKLMRLHGLSQDNTDFLKMFQKQLNANINDVSIDDNANKNEKTIAGIQSEASAPQKKIAGYDFLYRVMKELYGKKRAKRLIGEMLDFSLPISDSTKLNLPYCYALNATNLITEGRSFGVLPSKPAKRVNSYIAALCETIHQMSSHVAGALAIGTVFIDVAHLLMIKNKVSLDVLKNDKAVRKEIENEFQQLIHSVNHLSRDGVESPFTNVSVFDKHKLRYIIKEHLLWMFSDGGVVDIEECVDYVFELQEIFLDIFDRGDPSNNGMPYRFPVCTMNISKIKDGDDYILADEESLEIFLNRDISRYNIFTSESTKIASCCRLINDEEMLDVASTSNSFGAGVLSSIGSHRVVTLNFNKMALEAESIDDFWKIYTYRVEAAKDILIAHKVLIHVLEQIGLQPFITRGWIDLNRLFSTFGILGLYECEKVLKKRFGAEGDLKKKILTFLNRKARLYTKKNKGYVFNIEQIPAESMAVKVCSADKIIHGDTYIEYPLYANQFVPLWEEASLWDRLRIDGEYTKILTGGGIAHATVGQRLTREQAKKIICFALSCGCEHFAINTVYSECINSHVSMGSFSTCPICSEDISTQLTRVVGFFTPVKAWNKTRREFDFPYRKFVDKSI